MLNMGTSEQELIERCIRQDRKAQRLLYDRYKCAMYSIAVRLLGNYDDAADALQDAFVEIFLGLESFKFKSSLGAWMKTIVTRNAIAKFKRAMRYEIMDVKYLDHVVEWKDAFTAEYLEKAILELPDGTRAVFTLVAIEGFQHNEVAKMLNISEGTSKSQLHYAKLLLQKKLSEFNQ